MKITKDKGSHSERDEIIKVTCNDEAITLEDLFTLVKTFATNELRRIRYDHVRKEIINGERPFMFEMELRRWINDAKKEELEIIDKDCCEMEEDVNYGKGVKKK